MDFIKENCSILNIQVIYTNNKITILSSGMENNKPTIRLHKIFRNCDNETAYAIIKYFIDFKNSKIYMDKINQYVKQHLLQGDYKIKPPSKSFTEYIKKGMRYDNFIDESSLQLLELDISSIEEKNFLGGSSFKEPNESIKVLENDILEVDVIIAPFNT